MQPPLLGSNLQFICQWWTLATAGQSIHPDKTWNQQDPEVNRDEGWNLFGRWTARWLSANQSHVEELWGTSPTLSCLGLLQLPSYSPFPSSFLFPKTNVHRSQALPDYPEVVASFLWVCVSYWVRKKRHLCLEGGRLGIINLSMLFQAEIQCPIAVVSTWGILQAVMRSSPSEQKTFKTSKQILDNLKVAFPVLSLLVILIARSKMLGFSFSPGIMWAGYASFLRSEGGKCNLWVLWKQSSHPEWAWRTFSMYIILETVESS